MRGGPEERWIHAYASSMDEKLLVRGREEHSHYDMHFRNMYYSSDVCVMQVLGGYTASSYSALDRFVVHFQ